LTFYLIGGFLSIFLYEIYIETIGKEESAKERNSPLFDMFIVFLMSWVFCVVMISDFCVNKIKTGTWFVSPKKNDNES
jgi:hypothetical protein